MMTQGRYMFGRRLVVAAVVVLLASGCFDLRPRAGCVEPVGDSLLEAFEKIDSAEHGLEPNVANWYGLDRKHSPSAPSESCEILLMHFGESSHVRGETLNIAIGRMKDAETAAKAFQDEIDENVSRAERYEGSDDELGLAKVGYEVLVEGEYASTRDVVAERSSIDSLYLADCVFVSAAWRHGSVSEGVEGPTGVLGVDLEHPQFFDALPRKDLIVELLGLMGPLCEELED